MSIFNIEKDRKIHISIFVALISTVAISILIISSILYFNFEDILRNKIFNYTLNNLPQTDQSTEMMSGIANRISKQIYNDIHISEILNYTTKDIIEINAALLQLNYYRNTSEFIDSIYIYNDRSKTFYNSSDVGRNAIQNKKDFYDQDIVKVIENYGEYPSMMPIPRSISVEYPVEKKVNMYTYLLYDILSNGKEKNMIVINMSEDKLHKNSLDTGNSRNRGYFMIDRNGIVISDNIKYPMLTDLSKESYINKILKYKSSGYFVGIVLSSGVKFVAQT